MTPEPIQQPVPVQPAQPRPFRKDGLGYVYEPPGLGVAMRVDYLLCRGMDVEAELLVTATLPGLAGHILRQKVNLLGGTNLDRAAKTLMAKVELPRDGQTWGQILDVLAESVIRDVRKGEPFLRFSEINAEPEQPDTLEKLVLGGVANHLFAHSKSGKVWMAVGMLASVGLGIPFCGLDVRRGFGTYLDWEDRPKVWRDRVACVLRGHGLMVEPADVDQWCSYRRMRQPLHTQVNQIAQHISETGTSFLIVDSVELAFGSAGDRMSYADVAKRGYEALAAFGEVSSLLIDHVSGEGSQQQGGPDKAINSIMKRAWARNSVKLVKAQEVGAHYLDVGLYHDDSNHGSKWAPIGVRVDFSQPGAVRFERNDVRDVPEFTAVGSPLDRILSALRQGGTLTRKELTERTRLTSDAIRTYTNRALDRGLISPVGDHAYRLPASQNGQGVDLPRQGGPAGLRVVEPGRFPGDVDEDPPF